jgi:hypothetical protein
MSQPRHIVILGLRRSGTTAVWRIFRQSEALVAFDEPFNPKLQELPAEHCKQTRKEFIEIYKRDPAAFKKYFAPVHIEQETEPGLTLDQIRYLGFLLDGVGHAVLDVTRCHNKIAALREAIGPSVLIHLFRDPVSWVSSHLIPSDRPDVLSLRRHYDTFRLFGRTSSFNHWGMEALTSGQYRSATRKLLAAQGVDLPKRNAPAYQLLLAFWLGAFRLAERQGRNVYGEHYVSALLDDICSAPDHFIEIVYSQVGLPFRKQVSSLRSPPPPPRFDDKRWVQAAQDIGFSDAEITTLFRS